MAKGKITSVDRKEFKKTDIGKKAFRWLFMGCVLDFIAIILICILISVWASHLEMFFFYGILYLLMLIIIIGSESIGVYYGALAFYAEHNKEKKEIDYMD